ncbi:restriction endonuclease [Rummeliibacillus pycnus]|uniref:restriction endonuclease n=1 Tax=Rummeliibacillus pycnus TaxID=101070 RepID=UPI0037C5EEA3
MEQSNDYPNTRSWETRVSAMPNIPRGENGFPESLKCILTYIKKQEPINTKIVVPGSKASHTLEDLYVRLRPSGIVKKNKTGWQISDEADKWLQSEDNLYLEALLAANIKFFTEILAILINGPKISSEIQNVASVQYKLNWKTKSEVHARLGWLKDLQFISFEDFSLKYYITDLGGFFLGKVGYFKSENLKSFVDPTLNEKEIPMSDWAQELCKLTEDDIEQRKTSIGYYPGAIHDIHNTILDYLIMMDSPTDFSTIADYSSNTFGISESSARAFISSLINLNFIERKTKTLFQTTKLGGRFPTGNFELDFACCFNHKFSFVFEILFELQKEELSAKQLAVIAKVSHGFPSENKTEIHKRIHILKNASLIQETSPQLFGLTKRGENFCELLGSLFSIPKREIIERKTATQNKELGIQALLSEIRISSRDSSNPNRFEKVLVQAFSLLGFKSEWLGGAGKTDILLQAPTSPKFSYIVAVDAKSTYSGGVTESQINFDTLIEHRKKHNANYSIVVAPEFQGERLIQRAEKHNVVLIDLDQLEHLIKMHVEVPLRSDSYRKLFSQNGIINLKVIEEDRNKIIREGNLLQAIMKCLSDESEDPLTEGIMQPREIYLLLKNQIKSTPFPSIEEINQMLEFLSSPLIGCINKTKEGYYATGSLIDAAQKFDFYLKAFKNKL